MTDSPAVSILVLNFNGRDHLERCFRSVKALEYPEDRLEVVFVDNGSADGSVDYVRAEFPWIRVIALEENLGYAAAMNLGASEARHDLLMFLNNDTRVLPDALARLVEPIVEGRAAATGAKIVSWDGSEVHFAGGGTNFHGIAFQVGMGEPDRDEFRAESETLFACGAAMAIRKEVFQESGAFDEDFFAYYEDVDLGWRLWILGHRILYVPGAVVHHHHSATSYHIELYKLRVLHLRNPLQMLFKNYDDANLRRILPAALLLSARRTWYLAGVQPEEFRIGSKCSRKREGWLSRKGRARSEYREGMEVPKLAVSDLIAINDFVDKYPRILGKRERIQGGRRRPDTDIVPLFRDPFRCAETHSEYARIQDEICRSLGIAEVFEGRGVRER